MARVGIVLIVMVVTGCGRLGYSGDLTSTDLAVTASDSEIRVDAPGMYSLVFDEAHSWQASSWVDLTTGDGQELVGADRGGVLQAPFAVQYGGATYEVDSTDYTQRAIYELDADHVVFKVWYGWYTPDDSEIEVWATHEVHQDGTWTVSATVENKNDSGKQFGVVLAQTSLAAAAEWQETTSGSTVMLDAASGAHFELIPAAGQSATLNSDGMGAFYFDAGIVDLGANATADFTWTNRILP